MSDQRNDLVATNFLEEINQIISEIDGIQEASHDESAAPAQPTPSEHAPTSHPTPESVSASAPADDAAKHDEPAPSPAINLSEMTVRRQVQNWWLSPQENPTFSLDPALIIGAVVRTHRGSTSPITGVDPASRRIITRSGTVYELGMPEAVFAAKGRLVLRRLGF